MAQKNMLYIAYGSNLSIQQMKRRCPDSIPIRAYSLPGWVLHFARTATIIKSDHPKAKVYLALYEISRLDKTLLDYYEGVKFNTYESSPCNLTIDGSAIQGFTYIKTCSRSSMPQESYVNIIKKGLSDWNLPEDRLNMALKRCQKIANKRKEEKIFKPETSYFSKDYSSYDEDKFWNKLRMSEDELKGIIG